MSHIRQVNIFLFLDFSEEEYLRHLERHFEPGMWWGNYGRGEGQWQPDHIIPLSFFKKKFGVLEVGSDEHRIRDSLMNLRPLWHAGKNGNAAKGKRPSASYEDLEEAFVELKGSYDTELEIYARHCLFEYEWVEKDFRARLATYEKSEAKGGAMDTLETPQKEDPELFEFNADTEHLESQGTKDKLPWPPKYYFNYHQQKPMLQREAEYLEDLLAGTFANADSFRISAEAIKKQMK